jgi:hypothetical protein
LCFWHIVQFVVFHFKKVKIKNNTRKGHFLPLPPFFLPGRIFPKGKSKIRKGNGKRKSEIGNRNAKSFKTVAGKRDSRLLVLSEPKNRTSAPEQVKDADILSSSQALWTSASDGKSGECAFPQNQRKASAENSAHVRWWASCDNPTPLNPRTGGSSRLDSRHGFQVEFCGITLLLIGFGQTKRRGSLSLREF